MLRVVLLGAWETREFLETDTVKTTHKVSGGNKKSWGLD